MKVLVIGSGGREHALAWKFSQSPKVTAVYVAPGNPGTATLQKTINVPIASDDIPALFQFAKTTPIDLTFVGPEKPLTLGIVDEFRKNNLLIFGPEKNASELEASKEFAKKIMMEAGVPTASYQSFVDYPSVEIYLKNVSYPTVLKADGLAAGKGVQVCGSQQEAEDFAKHVLVNKAFGDSGNRLIVEEFLVGRECSILAMCDGNSYQLLASAQDHKRLKDDDQGPNTGGMGAYSPSPIFDEALEQEVRKKVFDPVLATLKKHAIQFTGILYAGLMVTRIGPKVLEFNVRFGDPETQVILPRLKNDFFEVVYDAAQGKLFKHSLSWVKDVCITVVLAGKGYPERSSKGDVIDGLRSTSQLVFHAGTARETDKVVTSGGRILNVTALGETMTDARKIAYDTISNIHFDGMQYRKDIGSTFET